MDLTENWSTLYHNRIKIRKRYPKIWSIRVIKNLFEILSSFLEDGYNILEIGAYNRAIKKEIDKYCPGINYKSMDIDQKTYQDYYSLDEIEGTYDIILLFEVIEHLTFQEGVEMLVRIQKFLKPGGKIMLTTPNLFHPNRYLDASHKTPYRYCEIGGVLISCGYKILDIYRISNDSILQKPLRKILLPLYKILDIDFAKSILVVAQKP